MHGWSTDGRIDVVSDWGSLANTNGLVKETTWRGWHGPAQLVELRRIHIGWELGLAKFKLAGATVVPMLRIERRFGTPYVFPQIMFAVLPVVWIIRAVRWRRREVL